MGSTAKIDPPVIKNTKMNRFINYPLLILAAPLENVPLLQQVNSSSRASSLPSRSPSATTSCLDGTWRAGRTGFGYDRMALTKAETLFLSSIFLDYRAALPALNR